eukprot:TRINITY_DN4146_c0_g2_i1.p1 TRINITY_DN4146_c0_g2~~TRINITY_DN4146_c0_g2_i1.p1  ORF type:complete len:222 (-),score=43.79 TRINITY_DN4146_c0_g2_i1:58-723(-)
MTKSPQLIQIWTLWCLFIFGAVVCVCSPPEISPSFSSSFKFETDDGSDPYRGEIFFDFDNVRSLEIIHFPTGDEYDLADCGNNGSEAYYLPDDVDGEYCHVFCAGGKWCDDGSSCNCGLISLWSTLANSTLNGTCGENGISYVNEIDGVYGSDVSVEYCIRGDIPLYIIEESPFGCFRMDFSNFLPGIPDKKVFDLPSYCKCTPDEKRQLKPKRRKSPWRR